MVSKPTLLEAEEYCGRYLGYNNNKNPALDRKRIAKKPASVINEENERLRRCKWKRKE
jgi:hypothetical protein